MDNFGCALTPGFRSLKTQVVRIDPLTLMSIALLKFWVAIKDGGLKTGVEDTDEEPSYLDFLQATQLRSGPLT